MTGKIDISPDQLETVQTILRAHLPKGTLAWAFGSRVTWTAKPFSDLDIALEGASDLPWKVDVIDLNAVSPEFRAIVERQRVPADWNTLRLGELVNFNPKLSLPKGTLVPFVEMAALPVNAKFISKIDQREVTGSGAKFQNGDTLFARITPCLENGKGGYVSGLSKDEIAQGSTEFIVLRAKDVNDAQYVYYLSRYEPFRKFAEQGMEGTSGRQRVTWQTLSDFEIPYLAPNERVALGEVLAALDDKIELNRRMNEVLEAMARALFRDWFVDFGPTRRQIEGATDPAAIMGHAFPAGDMPAEVGTGSASGISTTKPLNATTLAPLFPAKLGGDGLPEGWLYSDVGTEFDVEMGQSPPGDTYNETGDGLPFFQGRRDFGFRFPSRRVYCTAPKRISGRDWTLLSVRAPVGDINRAAEKCAIGRGVGAFLHKAGLHSFTYYTGLALRAELQSYDKDGTVFGSINQKQFKGLRVVVPSQSLAARFDEIAKSMDDKIRLNTEENQTLAALRDLLLPKLMSGEIRLKDAEACL
jgi:type I restriction enzyme S subunit